MTTNINVPANTTVTVDKHASTGFMSLPGEIRNRIYHLVLSELPITSVNKQNVYPVRKGDICRVTACYSIGLTDEERATRLAHRQVLRVAETCKAVRNELLSLYFEKPLQLVFYDPYFKKVTDFMAAARDLHRQELIPALPMGENVRNALAVDRIHHCRAGNTQGRGRSSNGLTICTLIVWLGLQCEEALSRLMMSLKIGSIQMIQTASCAICLTIIAWDLARLPGRLMELQLAPGFSVLTILTTRHLSSGW
ncbi:hypothetical protein EJ08DRAFT_709826 [Tothia fuscella]|uniref:Uncharacterized protein n=1 Tax=Tothia fuscella TaxID=1048955 RepID=A0A9P4NWK3_9PEZI|nr:hypothetical protein EJ08DRAFT_709826 [Tothia fuscella]